MYIYMLDPLNFCAKQSIQFVCVLLPNLAPSILYVPNLVMFVTRVNFLSVNDTHGQ